MPHFQLQVSLWGDRREVGNPGPVDGKVEVVALRTTVGRCCDNERHDKCGSSGDGTKLRFTANHNEVAWNDTPLVYSAELTARCPLSSWLPPWLVFP